MFKINIEDEKSFIKYLSSFEDKYQKRNKILNELLGIEDDNNWELLSSTSTFGQIYHQKFDQYTYLDKVSHVLKIVKKINGEYFGEIKVLKTFYGKTLDNLIKSGINLHLEPVYFSFAKKIIRIDIK